MRLTYVTIVQSKNMPITEIIELYNQIPNFECDKTCHDCCGPVPWAKSEWEPLKDKREGTHNE